MRTIEEIKKELQGITCITETPGQFPFLDHELRVQKLIDEFIATQDAEIARLRQQLEWQPIETAPRDEMIEIIHQWIKIPQIVRWTSKYHSPYDRLIQGFFRVEWPFDYIPLEIITGWRAIPPLPQPQEGSPMDNPLTDEVYLEEGNHE